MVVDFNPHGTNVDGFLIHDDLHPRLNLAVVICSPVPSEEVKFPCPPNPSWLEIIAFKVTRVPLIVRHSALSPSDDD
jgi:hypothetical protein